MATNDSPITVIFFFTVSNSNMTNAWSVKASVMLPPMTGMFCDIIHRNNMRFLLKGAFRWALQNKGGVHAIFCLIFKLNGHI